MARQAARKAGVPERLFLSMIEHESGWNPAALSSAGAVGLAQFMPGTAAGLGIDPSNPKQALFAGAQYLADKKGEFGNWRDALRAYNFGSAGARQDPENGQEYAISVLKGRNAYKKQGLQRPGGALPPMPGFPAGKSREGLWNLIFDDDPEFAALLTEIDANRIVDIPDRDAWQQGAVAPGGSVQRVQLPPGEVGNLIAAAQSQLGKPYVFGSGPNTDSFDCSDLIQWAYKQIGINIPRVTYDQIKAGRSVKGQPLQPGDLFFSSPGHVMMYVGHGKLISAPYTGTVVQYRNVSDYGEPYEVRRVMS